MLMKTHTRSRRTNRTSCTTVGALVAGLGLAGPRLRAAIKSGRLKAQDIGGELFITPAGLRDFARLARS
jgi:hypothetical protein